MDNILLNNNDQTPFSWLVWSLIVIAVVITISIPSAGLYHSLNNNNYVKYNSQHINKSIFFLVLFIVMLLFMMWARYRVINNDLKLAE